MFKGVLRKWPKHDFFSRKTSRRLEIGKYVDQAAGIPGLWRDLDLNSFIPVGLAHSFEQIHLLERFELYLKHLAEHVLALSGGVDQPWRVALTNQIERIPLVGDEDARHADSSIGTEVRETFLEGAEDEDKH